MAACDQDEFERGLKMLKTGYVYNGSPEPRSGWVARCEQLRSPGFVALSHRPLLLSPQIRFWTPASEDSLRTPYINVSLRKPMLRVACVLLMHAIPT
jgi:hypothetical protein